mgnify:CR=1 FL=1
MARYPVDPPQQRSPWLITAVLFLLVLFTAAALWVFSGGRLGLRLLATPTATATPRAPATATVDFRATQIAEDAATQIAFAAVMTLQTPSIEYVPVIMGGPDGTATAVSLNLVPIGGGDDVVPPETPTPDPNAPPTPGPPNVELPPGDDDGGEDAAQETPPEVPDVIETETPTPTETPFVFETETPTVTPFPTVYQVESLRARIRAAATPTTIWLRLAPLNTHTPVATLAPGAEVRLLGRDGAGEWVYLCCVNNNEPRWIRQAFAPPVDNTLPGTPPPSATPNDVRWLPTQPWPGNFPQPAVATPIPPDDHPHFRHDPTNAGRVTAGFSGNLVSLWPIPARTTQRITTAPVVAGQYVIVASGDGDLYGFDRTIGNQIWKFTVGTTVSQPPIVVDNILYFADDGGRAVAIFIGAGGPQWTTNLSIPSVAANAWAVTGFVAVGDYLLIGVSNGNDTSNYQIVQMFRNGGGASRAFNVGSVPPKALAVGGRMLYVVGNHVWALDIDTFELIWVRADLTQLTAAPVYSANGVTALAELYVATNNGLTYALDANTGATLHTYEGGGEVVNGLALSDSAVIASGGAFVKAYDRRSNGLFWRAATNGEMRNAAIVTPDQLLVVALNGAIQFFNPSSGAMTGVFNVPTSVTNAPAVSGANLYIAGEDGQLYAFTQ